MTIFNSYFTQPSCPLFTQQTELPGLPECRYSQSTTGLGQDCWHTDLVS